MKECSVCHRILETSEFHFSKANKDNLQTKCKKCNSEAGKLYKRTFNGLMSEIYSGQKTSSVLRGFGEITILKKDVIEFCENNEEFMKMFKEWEKSNYYLDLRPTLDRIDNSIGYTIENIQPMTYRDNVNKEHKSRYNGSSNFIKNRVIQMDKEENEIEEFHSISEAARQTGGNQSHIGSCCNGKRKTHLGFKWKFKETK